MPSTLPLALAAATALVLGWSGAAATGQTSNAPLRMTAFAVNMSNVGTGGAKTVDKKKNTVELENYASEPVRLQNVRAEAKK